MFLATGRARDQQIDGLLRATNLLLAGKTMVVCGAFCAAMALGELVKTFMPSVTGVAQAGIGFGAFSISTRHMRQLAATDSFSW